MEKRQSEQLGREIKSFQTRDIGGLPVIYPLQERIGVRELANELVPSQADVDLGRVVELLVVNRLLSPRPLYQVAEWMAETVLPELWEVTADQMYAIVSVVPWIDFTLIWVHCGQGWSVRRFRLMTWT